MSGFSVVPDRLQVSALQCDRVARLLADAAQDVASIVVPTGRADSAQQSALTVQRLAAALQALARDIEADGATLCAAAAGYTAVDRCAVGP